MPYERTGYAPWSLTREAGVESATVDGTIQVPQYIYPNLDTGFIDEKGVWQGRKSSDRSFIGFTTSESIANGVTLLLPDAPNFPSINMTGFRGIFLAFKPTDGGGSGFEVKSVMGPDTESFANLSPVSPNAPLRANNSQATPDDWEQIFTEGGQTMTADVWNIFAIKDILADWQNLQFRVTNNTGSTINLEFAFMRLI
jgi:hypothetical protein